MSKKALVTGITGQDGSYLAEFLLHKGYEVHGLIRRASTFNTARIDHIYTDPHERQVKLHLHYGDISDGTQLTNLLYKVRPDEIYHLAAQSHVKVSFDLPEFTGNITGLGTVRLLETLRTSGIKAKFYQASSSEMFGNAPSPQNENTPFCPRSPYAAAKVYAYWTVVNYREGYNIFACNGILFNHESPRRGRTFVTRKITRAIAEILAHRQQYLYLGNLESIRDWGYAPEYVELMWKMIQMEHADDIVVGVGEAYSVEDFVKAAFSYVGLDWEKYVKIDPVYFRPTEAEQLIADSTKANEKLGWEPKIKFHDLVKIMVDADMRAIGLNPIGEGDEIIRKTFSNKWWGSD